MTKSKEVQTDKSGGGRELSADGVQLIKNGVFVLTGGVSTCAQVRGWGTGTLLPSLAATLFAAPSNFLAALVAITFTLIYVTSQVHVHYASTADRAPARRSNRDGPVASRPL